jgi:hypothetical protein
MVTYMKRNNQEWISLEEAAAEIQIAPESILSLANEGLVRKLDSRVNRSDLQTLSKLMGVAEIDPDSLSHRVRILESTVSRLKEAIDILFQVNNMSSSRFSSMEDTELTTLYENICSELNKNNWDIGRILSCCEVFIRIGECEIEKLNNLVGTNHSWKPLYELCLKQSKYVNAHPKLETDANLQRCRELLNVGRKNIREIAVVFIEVCNSLEPSYKLVSALATTDIDTFNTLVKQLTKDRSKPIGLL